MTSASNGVAATLDRYRSLTQTAMRDVLHADTSTAHLCEPVREYPARGGKGIRPALVLATCQAFGGSLDEALGTAVAIEMLHNAFLVHDDISDGTSRRRGRPTLHSLYGVGLALTAGDALASRALQVVRDDTRLSPRVAAQVVDEFLTVVRQTTEGQALDLGWHRGRALDLCIPDYLLLAAKKTCWYTTVAPLRLGAIIGSRGRGSLRALSRFGFFLGVAFQIRDDLLDLESDVASLGKDVGSDLRERKRTLMVLHLLEAVRGADREALVEWLTGAGNADGSSTVVLDLMRRYRSLEVARGYGAALTAEAETAFHEAFGALPPSEHTGFLLQMIPYMLGRRD